MKYNTETKLAVTQVIRDYVPPQFFRDEPAAQEWISKHVKITQTVQAPGDARISLNIHVYGERVAHVEVSGPDCTPVTYRNNFSNMRVLRKEQIMPDERGPDDARDGESVQGEPRGGPGERDEHLDRRFTYHAPKGDQPERYVTLRQTAKGLAEQITALCPASRERSVALTNLEQAVMWANASIARNE